MIKNYFTLNRFVIEANIILNDKSITAVFSQEKDRIVFEINDGDHFIEMNVNPGSTYVTIRDKYYRAKKNTINVFINCIKNKIGKIAIADNDRIVLIKSDKTEIYFTIRGKFTNVICKDRSGNLEAFKKIEQANLNSLYNEIISQNYISEFNQIDLSLKESSNYFYDMKKKYPLLGSEIISEAKRRLKENDSPERILSGVLNDLKSNKAEVLIDKINNEVHLSYDGIGIFNFSEKKEFNSIIEAQNYYLSKKYFLSEKQARLKLIQKHLERELVKLSNKISNLRKRIEAGNRESEYKNIANLLLTNIYNIKPGMKEIILIDLDTEKTLKIKLDPKTSANKNVDAYFNKAKSERISFEKSLKLLTDAENEYQRLKNIETRLEEIDDQKELSKLMKDLKIKDTKEKSVKDEIKSKFKHYLIDGKYNVFAGKDSKTNDLLTTKFAKQNDYWFHARSVSGSHVILRVDNTKESVPKNILKKAAALAAYHSKAKTAGVVPVTYTFKKYVVKKKGDPIGTVRLLREDVLLVKPEIPTNCEFITDA